MFAVKFAILAWERVSSAVVVSIRAGGVSAITAGVAVAVLGAVGNGLVSDDASWALDSKGVQNTTAVM